GEALARGGPERRDGRGGRRRRDHCRKPEPPPRVLAVRRVARRDVKDPARDQGAAPLDRQLGDGQLPRADDVRGDRHPEERDRRVAKLPRAVGREGRERHEAERDHGRADQTRSATMRTVASHTPARCSKSAKPAELSVTARSRTPKAAIPAGTGSAAQTKLCSRAASGSRAGRSGWASRATTTAIAESTATPIVKDGSSGP